MVGPRTNAPTMSGGCAKEAVQLTSYALHSPETYNMAASRLRKTAFKAYVRFSDKEHEMLRIGVDQFGTGRWKCILHAYPFHPKRSAVDLKDKWRNILRKQERQRMVFMKEATATAAATMSPGDAFVSAANERYARVVRTSRGHEGSFSSPRAAGTSATQLKPHNGVYSSNWPASCSAPLPSASSSPTRAAGGGVAGGFRRDVCYAMSDCSDGGVSSWPEVETDVPVDSLSQIPVADLKSPMCREGGVGRSSCSPVLCDSGDDDAPSRMKLSFLLCG